MARGRQSGEPTDWVSRAADDALRHAGDLTGDRVVTCSSGASPSGPVHLGNLREFLTVHFVADELSRRGVPVRHLHVWDDYDRFRKVPAGVDASWSEHIGRPLSAVPDPTGEFPNWAERYKAPLRSALTDLGCEMVEVDQTEMYRSGTYREQVLTAIRKRGEIETVLARFRTKKAEPTDGEESEDDDQDRRQVEIEQERTLPIIPHHALNPKKRRDARAAGHRANVMEAGGGVKDHVAGGQLHRFHSVGILHAKFAAIVFVVLVTTVITPPLVHSAFAEPKPSESAAS